ncbi:ABC transporter substrate binding protein [Baekduia alba]|uniref:ABC transporter substrate binding protein n=1 Tax=Baekduia alba TaxID=2997333 RepID=UPI002341AAB1|nr:ABC transporter substrate binding protein [Baekduia alba]
MPIFDTYVKAFKVGFAREAGLAPDQLHMDVKSAQGDVNLLQNLARNAARDSSYNAFEVIGTSGVIGLAKLEKTRPIIGIGMTDPVGAGVAKTLERPGANVTGTTSSIPTPFVVKFLEGMNPKPKTIGTIGDPSYESFAAFADRFRAALPPTGMKLVEAGAAGPGDVATAARSLVDRVDVIVLGTDILTTGTGLPAIAAQAKAHNVPLIIAAPVDPHTQGATAVLAPSNEQLGEIGGKQAARIFLGKAKAATTPFYAIPPHATVDQAAAKTLGVSFSPATFG